MDRELAYQMPFERLVKLSRSAGRKAFRRSWLALWLIIALFFGGIALLIVFDRTVQAWQASIGLPWFTAFAALVIAYFAALWALRRFGLRQMKSRADYD